MDNDFDDLLSSEAAAEALRQKPQTLSAWRCRGKGPRFFKLGARVFYKRADLSAWIQDQARDPRVKSVRKPGATKDQQTNRLQDL